MTSTSPLETVPLLLAYLSQHLADSGAHEVHTAQGGRPQSPTIPESRLETAGITLSQSRCVDLRAGSSRALPHSLRFVVSGRGVPLHFLDTSPQRKGLSSRQSERREPLCNLPVHGVHSSRFPSLLLYRPSLEHWFFLLSRLQYFFPVGISRSPDSLLSLDRWGPDP